MIPVNIQIQKISNLDFSVLGAGKRETHSFDLVLAAVDSVLDFQHIEIFIWCQHLNKGKSLGK